MIAAECSTFLCFDPVRSASTYSQISGVVAGFAFLAIILLLQAGPRREDASPQRRAGFQNVTICFLTAFVVALVASFLAAQLSREETVTPRAFTLTFLSGAAFSAAVLILLFGIVWLFKSWGMEEAASFAGRITGSIVPALVFLYSAAAGLEGLALQEGHRPTGTWLGWLLLVLLLALMVWSVESAKSARLLRLARRVSGDGAVRATAYVTLGVAVVAAIASGIIQELHVGFSLHREGTAAAMAALFVGLVLYALVVRAAEHRNMDGDE